MLTGCFGCRLDCSCVSLTQTLGDGQAAATGCALQSRVTVDHAVDRCGNAIQNASGRHAVVARRYTATRPCIGTAMAALEARHWI